MLGPLMAAVMPGGTFACPMRVRVPVISQVASNALVVTLSSQSPTANLGFNDSTNTFYPITPAAAFARRGRTLLSGRA